MADGVTRSISISRLDNSPLKAASNQDRSGFAVGKDDVVLRYSKSTGDLVSKPHGILSSIVRFIAGPTAQDVKDNVAIRQTFVAQFAEQFGSQVAEQALLQMNFLREGRDGRLEFNGEGPLTIGTVRRAWEAADEIEFGAEQRAREAAHADEAAARADDLRTYEATLDSVAPRPAAGAPLTAQVMKREFLAQYGDVCEGWDDLADFQEQRNEIDSRMSGASLHQKEACLRDYGALREKVGDFVQWIAEPANDGSNARAMAFVKDIRALDVAVTRTNAIVDRDDLTNQEPLGAAIRAHLDGLPEAEVIDLACRLNTRTSNGFRLECGMRYAEHSLTRSADDQTRSAFDMTRNILNKIVDHLEDRAAALDRGGAAFDIYHNNLAVNSLHMGPKPNDWSHANEVFRDLGRAIEGDVADFRTSLPDG